MGSERWTTASRSNSGDDPGARRSRQGRCPAVCDLPRRLPHRSPPHDHDPLRKALEGFVEQLQPTDIVVLMDPLTTLDSLRYTRNKQQLLERIQKFEGRRGELFPVRSAVEEMQMTQRNVWELRAGVSLSALEAIITHFGGIREGRKSVLFVSQGPPVGMPAASTTRGWKRRCRPPTAATSRSTCWIPARSARPPSAAPKRCGGCRRKPAAARSSTRTTRKRD